MPRLVNWNIRQGGGTRVSAIADAIIAVAPDMVVLAEYRPNAGAKALRYRLTRAGLPHQRCASATTNLSSVFVASREPLTLESSDWWPDEDHWRMLVCSIDGIRLVATYFPAEASHIASAFGPVLQHTHQLAADGVPTLLVGDLNAGDCQGGDLQSGTFNGGDGFRALLAAGWMDLWRAANPDAVEFSWFSRSKWGEFGFRLDHALALNWPPYSQAVARYDHEVRQRGLSDHSMLIVDWVEQPPSDISHEKRRSMGAWQGSQNSRR